MGGMVYIFLCGLSMMERLSKAFFGVKLQCSFQVLVIIFFGIILILILVITSVIILASSNGTTSTCHDCCFVSCLTFPFWALYDQNWWYCDDCNLVTADAHKNKDTRNRQMRSGRGKHRMVRVTMMCRTAEVSFGCVCDVVVVMGGGGGVVLVRSLCVREIE